MINCEGCFAPCCMAIECPLLVDGRCSDYENRPGICNSDYMFDTHYHKYMSRDEYDALSEQTCSQLRDIYRERQ